MIPLDFLDTLLGDRAGYVATATGDAGENPGGWQEHTYPWPADRDRLAREMAQEAAAGRQVWFCPALRLTPARNGAGGPHGTNAAPPLALWADLDDAPADPALVEQLAPITVASGGPGRRHLYVPLDRPVDVATHRRLNQALARRLGADAKWSDESLLRLPGTVNRKRVQPAAVEITGKGEGRRWAVADVARLLGVDLDAPAPAAPAAADLPQREPARDLPERLVQKLRAIEADPARKTDGTVDRSETIARVVFACVWAGMRDGQVLDVVARCPWQDKYAGDPQRMARDVAALLAKTRETAGRLLADRDPDNLVADGVERVAGPTPPGEPAADADAGEQLDQAASLRPLDLGAILDGTFEPPTATLLPRIDGVGLVYPGKVHWVYGEPESGKSFVCQYAAALVLLAGGRVLYLDYESDAADVVERLRALGVPADAIRERLAYLNPDVPVHAYPGAFDELLDAGADLAVIDGVNEALAIAQVKSNDTDEVTAWIRRTLRKITKRTGAAALAIDHVTKAEDGRGRFPIGSQAKLAAVDGAAFLVDVIEPIGRGMVGRLKIRVTKDRPGGVRPHAGSAARTATVAEFVMDASDGAHLAVTLAPPSQSSTTAPDGTRPPFRPTGFMERVSELLEGAPGLSANEITKRIKGKREHVLAGLDRLVEEGHVRREQTTGRGGPRSTHVVVQPFRELYDTAGPDTAGNHFDPNLTGNRPAAGEVVPGPRLTDGGNRGNHFAPRGSSGSGNHLGTTWEPLRPAGTPGTTSRPKINNGPGTTSGTTSVPGTTSQDRQLALVAGDCRRCRQHADALIPPGLCHGCAYPIPDHEEDETA